MDGIMHPVFSSIEEWLGIYTDDYYNILAEVARGHWSPENQALPWVRFCLKAHYQQATTLLRRMEEYGKLYTEVENLLATHKLHDRMAMPLFDAALGMTLTNARYQEDAEVTGHIASRDLRTLSDLGILEPKGETRARRYSPGKDLANARQKVRISRPMRDPYDIVRERALSQDEPLLLF